MICMYSLVVIPVFVVLQEHSCTIFDNPLNCTWLTQPTKCNANTLDQYYHGWTTSAEVCKAAATFTCISYLLYPAVKLPVLIFFYSLGVEPVDKDVMTRPPRRATDKMITLPLLAQIFGAAMMIVAGTLYVFRREVSQNS